MTAAWSAPAFERIARIFSQETGLTLAASHVDAESGIRRAMARAEVSDVREFAELLAAHQLSLDDLIGELTVGETYFFRDPHHFEFIRDRVFSDLVARRGYAHPARIWSAGCATGEEAYSLAIALGEAGLQGQVLATDLSRAALQKAREATYRDWSLRGLDESLIERCFHRKDNLWVLDRRFRSGVTFESHNLARGGYPSVPTGMWGMDLILCRNVLIYLDAATVRRAARGLTETLAEGGWLVTGPSDPPLDGVDCLTPVIAEQGVFYRKTTPHVTTSTTGPSRNSVVPNTGTSAATGVTGLAQPSIAQPHRADTITATATDTFAEVRAAFAAGRYARVLEATRAVEDEAIAALRVRAMANRDGSESALTDLEPLLARFPHSTELHLLQAVLRMDVNRHDEAIDSLRCTLYLDRSLAFAHFLLAIALRRRGRFDEARRAYRNARNLAAACPPDEPLPLADGERAGRIADIASSEIESLNALRVAAS